MWESKGWIVLERLMALLTLCVLAFAVWKTLLEVKTEQAKQSKQINATLEAIRQGMDSEQWQKVKLELESSLEDAQRKKKLRN